MTGNYTVNLTITDENGNQITQSYGLTGTGNVVAAYLRGIATDLADQPYKSYNPYQWQTPIGVTYSSGSTGTGLNVSSYGVGGSVGGAGGASYSTYIDQSKLAQGSGLSESSSEDNDE